MINKKQNSSNLSKMRSEVLALKRNMMNLKFQKSTGQLEKTSEIRKTKKRLARLKTEINKSIGESNA